MIKKIRDSITILTGQYAIILYLFVFFVIYPLYVRNGYYDIDSAKFLFLKYTTGYGMALILIGCIIQLLMRRVPPQLFSGLSITDCFVIAYIIINILSYYFSYSRYTSLWGQTGWYMGALTSIAFSVIYFVVTRFFLGSKLIIPMILIASEIVFLLGILNRFGIWPIPIGIPFEHSYLSTLGNLGWYSSYVAVIAPLGIGLYIIRNKQSIFRHVIMSVYVFTVFVTGLSQGGDSIFIFFAILLLGAMFVASIYKDGLKNWLEILIMWCLAGQLVHFIRIICPDAYGYDSENFCGRFNSSFASLWILIPVVLIYLVVVLKHIRVFGWIEITMRIMPVVVVGSGLIWLIAAILYSNHIGIGTSADDLDYIDKLFFIDGSWGGARGTSINIGLNIWLEQSFGGKLIGIGQDCFAVYTAGSESYSALIYEHFGDALLTNAHNEFLTNLADIGIFGTLAYYGIFAAFLYRCSKLWKKDMRVVAIALCLICYNGYNLLNYAELLNYPFYMVLIALGETWMKQVEVNEEININEEINCRE